MPTLEYRTDEAAELRSLHAQFRLMLGARWLAVLLLLGAGTGFLVADGPRWFTIAGLVLSTCALVLTLLWVKTYWVLRSIVLRHVRLLEDPTIRIDLTEEGIEVRSSSGSNRARWSDLTRKSTREYLVLYSGALAFVAIPRAALTEEAETLVDARVR